MAYADPNLSLQEKQKRAQVVASVASKLSDRGLSLTEPELDAAMKAALSAPRSKVQDAAITAALTSIAGRSPEDLQNVMDLLKRQKNTGKALESAASIYTSVTGVPINSTQVSMANKLFKSEGKERAFAYLEEQSKVPLVPLVTEKVPELVALTPEKKERRKPIKLAQAD